MRWLADASLKSKLPNQVGRGGVARASRPCTTSWSCAAQSPLIFSLRSLSACLQVPGLHAGRSVLSQRVSRGLHGAQRPREVRGLPQLLPGRQMRGHLPARVLSLRGLALRHLRLLPGAAQQVQKRPGVGVSRYPQQRVCSRVPLGVHHELQQVSARVCRWGKRFSCCAFLSLGRRVCGLCQD